MRGRVQNNKISCRSSNGVTLTHRIAVVFLSLVLGVGTVFTPLMGQNGVAYADDYESHSYAPYPSLSDNIKNWFGRHNASGTTEYRVNAPKSEHIDVRTRPKQKQGNAVFARDDQMAIDNGFDVKGEEIWEKDTNTGTARRLYMDDNGGQRFYYVRDTEIVPAGETAEIPGISRYVVDENLDFVEPGMGTSTGAPSTTDMIDPLYTFDSSDSRSAELKRDYLDATGTAMVALLPKYNEDTGKREWYWCVNPTASVPYQNSMYYEIPLSLSPQANFDKGVEVMYMANTVMENAGMNTPDNGFALDSRQGIPSFTTGYQNMRAEYLDLVKHLDDETYGENEPSAFDPHLTKKQVRDSLKTLLEGGTIASGTIYEETIPEQKDKSLWKDVPNRSSSLGPKKWETAHIGVLGVEYAFLKYIQGWPAGALDIFQGGDGVLDTAGTFKADNDRTKGGKMVARMMIAYTEAARKAGLLEQSTTPGELNLTTEKITRADGKTTVTVKVNDVTNENTTEFYILAPENNVEVASTSAYTTSNVTDGFGVTRKKYTFSEYPDEVTLSTTTENENALRDDVLFTKVGDKATIAKTYANVDEIYRDEKTGHYVVREFVGANYEDSDSAAEGRSRSQTVLKLTPEKQQMHARISLKKDDTVSVKVQKKWAAGLSPAEVTVDLLRNGEKYKSIKLDGNTDTDETTAWEYTFTGLPKNDASGNEYKYTVAEEEDGEKYDAVVTKEDGADNSFIITNNENTTQVSVEKVWNGVAQEDQKPVVIDLLRNGKKYKSINLDGVIDDKETEKWKYTFTELPKVDASGNDYKYTVSEEGTEFDSSVTGTDNDFTVTNKPKSGIDIPVEKKWVDVSDEAKVPVTIQLYRKTEGSSGDPAEVEGARVTLDGKTDAAEKEPWKYTFVNLPEADTDGTKYVYSVREVADSDFSDRFTTSVTGDSSSGFVITNSPGTKTTRIKVVKKWHNTTEGSVSFALYRNNGTEPIDTLTLTGEDGKWEGTFEDLPVFDQTTGEMNSYDVVETTEGYNVDTQISSDDNGYVFTFTNSKPKVHTTVFVGDAPSNDNNELTTKAGTAKVKDKVSYYNLEKGQEYTVKGKLIDVTENNAVKETSSEFTADSEDGTAYVDFGEVDLKPGHKYVVFESVYKKGETTPVAEHNDSEDKSQTFIAENEDTPSPSGPSIHTTVSVRGADSNADNELMTKPGKAEVKDTIAYYDLEKGQKYTVKGQLIDVTAGDKVVKEASAEFTADNANGTAVVDFGEVDLTPEHKYVVFESVYKKGETTPTAEHKDRNDKSQTFITEKKDTTSSSSIHTTVSVSGTPSTDESALTTKPGKADVKDTVSYYGLEKGQKYTVKGQLIDVTDGDKVVKEASSEFTADNANGTAVVDFGEVDLKSGHKYVVFESIYKNGEEKPTAEHKDRNDKSQTFITKKEDKPSPSNPSIHTTVSANGSRSDSSRSQRVYDTSVKVVDKVYYKGLSSGHKYTVKGKLVDLTAGDKVVAKASKTFTAPSKSGSVNVNFGKVKLTAGHKYVVFEKLYENGELIASHKDRHDKAQTFVVEKPASNKDNGGTGKRGDRGGSIDNGNNSNNVNNANKVVPGVGVRTGDTTGIVIDMIILSAAVLAALLLAISRKRRHRQDH